MNTVGELLDELARFPRAARIAVKVNVLDLAEIRREIISRESDEADCPILGVMPEGCNLNDVRLHLEEF